MDSALKGLMLAAGVILTCVVIGVGFFVAREAKATALSSSERLSDFKKEISESYITKYDDMEVTGSDVVNFTKKLLNRYEAGEIAPVYVKIEASGHTQCYVDGSKTKELRDVTSKRYVRPLSMFLGEVVRDENDVIVGIVFAEQ